MRLNLHRNCRHGSFIYLLEQRGEVHFFIKSATHLDGIKNLLNEYEGLSWYWGQKDSDAAPSFFLEKVTKNYVKLKTKKSTGFQLNPKRSISKNYDLLVQLIDHYCKVWGTNNSQMVPLHGDLSLDNIFFQDDRINILDWEHFSYNSVPWGFDILYAIYEMFWFGLHKKFFKNSRAETHALVNLIVYLFSRCDHPEKIQLCSLSDVVDYMNNNIILWGCQIKNFPMKFPVLFFEESKKIEIDNKVNSALGKIVNA
jgi:hypothetical protein